MLNSPLPLRVPLLAPSAGQPRLLRPENANCHAGHREVGWDPSVRFGSTQPAPRANPVVVCARGMAAESACRAEGAPDVEEKNCETNPITSQESWRTRGRAEERTRRRERARGSPSPQRRNTDRTRDPRESLIFRNPGQRSASVTGARHSAVAARRQPPDHHRRMAAQICVAPMPSIQALRQRCSVQLSENASAQVLNGRPSRSRGQGWPRACSPSTVRRAPSAGISTVHTP
jgi:hypothetical protein